jgi:uncharacterized membrane protein YeiH
LENGSGIDLVGDRSGRDRRVRDLGRDGGVLRDVLCNEIPGVSHDHRPCRLCAFIGCAIFLGLNALGAVPELSTTGLRLLAV